MDDLTISGASAIQRLALNSLIETAVAEKTLDAIEAEGEAALALIEASTQAALDAALNPAVDPALGDGIDLLV